MNKNRDLNPYLCGIIHFFCQFLQHRTNAGTMTCGVTYGNGTRESMAHTPFAVIEIIINVHIRMDLFFMVYDFISSG